MASNRVSKPIQRKSTSADAVTEVASSETVNKTVNREGNSKFDKTTDGDRDSFASRITFSASRNTFAQDYNSRQTFTDSHADNLFRRTVTTATAALTGDAEEEWTKSLLVKYEKVEEKSVAQGSMPQPAAFAQEINFWKAFFFACFLGALLGLCTLGFMNFTDAIPRLWVNQGPSTYDDNFFQCDSCGLQETLEGLCVCDKYQNCQWYKGYKVWIAITTSAGLLVGILRYFASYPNNLPGLFQEIHSYHVDPQWAPYTIIISAISLAGGASLGPEQGLGNLGGGLATYFTHEYLSFDDDDYRKLSVLAGMAASLGALFPSPLLGVLMFQELGNPPKSYMESTLILAGGACVSFLVYFSLVNETFTQSITTNGEIIAAEWDFEEDHCLIAVVIGTVSACLALVLVLFIGITRQIFNRIRLRLEKFPVLVHIVPPTLAGVVIGTVNWALPLTVGNGNQTLAAIIHYGYTGQLSSNLLLCTLFSRMFLIGVSMNSGFIGGFIFPIIAIGIISGVVANQMYPSVPLGCFVGCFMAAVPSSICPMPLTLCGISIYCFFFGLYQTAPIFIAAITSYTLIVGTGLFGELQKKGQAQEMKPDEGHIDMKDLSENVEKDKHKSTKIENKRASTKAPETATHDDTAAQIYMDQLYNTNSVKSPLAAE